MHLYIYIHIIIFLLPLCAIKAEFIWLCARTQYYILFHTFSTVDTWFSSKISWDESQDSGLQVNNDTTNLATEIPDKNIVTPVVVLTQIMLPLVEHESSLVKWHTEKMSYQSASGNKCGIF